MLTEAQRKIFKLLQTEVIFEIYAWFGTRCDFQAISVHSDGLVGQVNKRFISWLKNGLLVEPEAPVVAAITAHFQFEFALFARGGLLAVHYWVNFVKNAVYLDA